jgi:hypothetical protein
MTSPSLRFRPATVADRDVILRHRRGMFRDMGQGTGAELDRMVEATKPWLERALADGSYPGWLAECKGRVVASSPVEGF